MIVKPYKGRHSVLALKRNPAKYLHSWRGRVDPARAPAIRELGRRLQAAGVRTAAGPVLSGALFAQAIEDATNGEIRAAYLKKPGYITESHAQNLSVMTPWVFVDDIIAGGRSARRAARIIEPPPVAAIAFAVNGFGYQKIPRKWKDVPILTLCAR